MAAPIKGAIGDDGVIVPRGVVDTEHAGVLLTGADEQARLFGIGAGGAAEMGLNPRGDEK